MKSSFWNGKRVLITGANGFLGSHLTKALVDRGNKPWVLIYEEKRDSIFSEYCLRKSTKIIKGDIRNYNLVAKILAENKIDSIFHFAAQAIVDKAVIGPLETLETNINGTVNILEAARRYGKAERIIVASSDKAYGPQKRLPYREHIHSLSGAYPYEVSKSCVDLVAQSYARTFGLPVVITRCTNLYGPGDLNWNRVVPRTIQRIFNNQPPVIRDSGRSTRDYLYIEDAVSAYLKLAERVDSGLRGQAFNISTSKPFSVVQVIRIISNKLSKRIKPEVVKTQGLEIKQQYSSFAKIKKLTGWKPEYTLDKGLERAIPWYVNYLKNRKNSDEIT